MRPPHRDQDPRCAVPAGNMRVPAILLLVILLPVSLWGQWSGGPTGPIYYSGGNVGIGTTDPVRKLHIVGGVFADGMVGVVLQPDIPTWDSIRWSNSMRIGVAAPSTMRLEATGGFQFWGNVGIGTTNPGIYKLAVEGTIGARDLIVTNSPWSDYVFRPGYRLQPLSEVNAYVQAHHHLPDIPSETEVKAKGVSVGEMQSKLLAKIEELTLHMIRAENDNRELKEANAQLQQRVARLEGK